MLLILSEFDTNVVEVFISDSWGSFILWDGSSITIQCSILKASSINKGDFYKEVLLRLLDTYAAKTQQNTTPLHVPVNNSAAGPSFKNVYDTFRPSSQQCQKFVYICGL